jgi:dipeptidyl aminopeptidase/acylaminoacyl peptidase
MSVPLWEQRFRAPVSYLPEWSPRAPQRVVYPSNESGIWQVHALDLETGARRQVTDHPVGLTDGTPTLDGEGILWFQDETGAESGQWLVQPFDGGETAPFLSGVPPGWNMGLAQAPGVVAVAVATDGGFGVYVSLEGAPVAEVVRSPEAVVLGSVEQEGFLRGGLSADGSLLCLEHSEHGDLIHPALRVVDPRTGTIIGELRDPGLALAARCWSPAVGDTRLAFVHEREGDGRPGLWDLATGDRHDLQLPLEGEVRVEDWWPDASALLLVNRFEGRDTLLRYDLVTGALDTVPTDPGVVMKARVRPSGRVWLVHESAQHPGRVLDDTGAEVLQIEGASSPPARPLRSWHFENPHGQRVHGFLATPEGDGPFPVVMLVHGGPTWLDLDRWHPAAQSLVDAGLAVGMVNYRGSIGYGREWRDALIGDVGGPELEDVNAGLHDLVDRGIADPARAVIAGGSWGGYVTLLELGKHPDLWLCGVAAVPVGDYEAAYEESAPLLQAYDRALLGGEPKNLPELMRDRSPIHFTDEVRAPVLILIGRNDSRCPFGQAMAYVDKLAERGHSHELYVYETGHGSFDVDERVRQARIVLEFLARHVPGVSIPAS